MIVSCYYVTFVIPQHIHIVLAWEEKYLKETGTVEDVDSVMRDHHILEFSVQWLMKDKLTEIMSIVVL
jgi:hypothetical protein